MKNKLKEVIILIITVLITVIAALAQEYKEQRAKLEVTQQKLSEYKADEAEIYPCPFCGSEAVELKESCGWYVRCEDCGGAGPVHDPNKDIWDENTKAEAIEWWNHNARE